MRISGSQDRSTAAVVVGAATALVLAVGALVAWTAMRGGPSEPRRTTPTTAVASIGPGARAVGLLPAVQSLAVLRDWDRARAQAWADGDVEALRALYLPGSAAGRRDVTMLRSWRGRGLRVTGMRMQLLAVELRSRTARRVVLVVTDRLVGASAAPAEATASPLALPHDRATRRRLVFERRGAHWLLASVTPVA